jgi:hypothetical protein
MVKWVKYTWNSDDGTMVLVLHMKESWRVGVRSTIAASIDIFTSVKCARLETGITLGGSKVFNETT